MLVRLIVLSQQQYQQKAIQAGRDAQSIMTVVSGREKKKKKRASITQTILKACNHKHVTNEFQG